MTRMVSTDETTTVDVDAWQTERPSIIELLEEALDSAFHSAEYTEGLSWEHRLRTYDDIMAAMTDAASAAARSGYAARALAAVDAAALNPPEWASGPGSRFWHGIVESGRDAILATLAA